MTDRVVVTGAAGFVGRHLTERLVREGLEVVASDLSDPAIPGAQFHRCDITDATACAALCDGATTVYHVASLVQTRRAGADLVWAVNRGGTRNLLRAGADAGVRQFIYVSSASVVYEGGDIENGDESLPYTTISQAPYADSKLAAERDVVEATSTMLTCAIRPHVVYGPGDTRFFPAILTRARAGKLTLGVGREHKLSDFTYIDNLVDALLLARQRLTQESGLGGRIWFITNGEPLSFWEFVDRTLDALALPRTRGRIPYVIAYAIAACVEFFKNLTGTAGPEDGFTRFAVRYMCTHHYFSIERARRELGYEPAVSIDEGIRRTVAWFNAQQAPASEPK